MAGSLPRQLIIIILPLHGNNDRDRGQRHGWWLQYYYYLLWASPASTTTIHCSPSFHSYFLLPFSYSGDPFGSSSVTFIISTLPVILKKNLSLDDGFHAELGKRPRKWLSHCTSTLGSCAKFTYSNGVVGINTRMLDDCRIIITEWVNIPRKVWTTDIIPFAGYTLTNWHYWNIG